MVQNQEQYQLPKWVWRYVGNTAAGCTGWKEGSCQWSLWAKTSDANRAAPHNSLSVGGKAHVSSVAKESVMRIHSRKLRKTWCFHQQLWYWPILSGGNEKGESPRSKGTAGPNLPSSQLQRTSGPQLEKQNCFCFPFHSKRTESRCGENLRENMSELFCWLMFAKYSGWIANPHSTWQPTHLSRSPRHRGTLWLFVRTHSFNKYLPSTYYVPSIAVPVGNTYITEG